MINQPISRRTALRGLGATIALPLLEAMSGARLAFGAGIFGAKAVAEPVRLLFMYLPNGQHMQDWTPKETGTEFELPPILKNLEKYKNDFNVLSGLTLNGARALGDGGGDHARAVAAYLTGFHPRKTDGADILNSISIDQLAASKIGHLTRLPSLELGTESSSPSGHCDSGYSCAYASNMSWRTSTSPVAKEIDPALVFDRLFRGSDLALSPEERAQRDRRRRSVLDFVAEDAKSLHQKLGANDKRKLDEYLFGVREIEKRISQIEKNQSQGSTPVDLTRPGGVPRDYGEHVKLLMDMIVLAFQTDTTRIATFMFANAGNNRSYREIGVAEGHHDLSHHGHSEAKQAKISQINQYQSQLFAHLLERLSTTRDRNGTLLDNSLIVYGSGISDGNSHNHHDLPIVLAGRGGGAIQTGRHLKFPRETPLMNLYLKMLNQIGIEEKSFSDSTGVLDI
jgi:Protein of unknown function (DUF1552)